MSISSVIDFVQLVKSYPCIYNSDLPDYARKDTTEVAWQEVANELNCTVTECKDKWKNIRNGYVRSLKPSFNGVPKKPYYLCEALNFILPYINPAANIQTDKRKLRDPIAEEDSDDDEVEINEEVKVEEVSVSPEPERVLRKPKVKVLRKRPGNDVDKAFAAWLQSKKPKESDFRKMFLLSLLADVNKLTEEQLGVFRIKSLMLLEEVKSLSGRGLQRLLNQHN